MDLKDILRNVFLNKDEEKYLKMIENLKDVGVDSASDLKYLDEEVVNRLESFNNIEIKKLKDFLEKFKFESLEEVLNELYVGTPKDRITEIKKFLNENEIYVRRDISASNIDKLKAKDFFSESELTKIKCFVEKNLIQTLYILFDGADMKRISEIEKILKSLGITAKNDLMCIDMDLFRRGKILSDIEVSKIESFLEEKDVTPFLIKIFIGTSTNRLEEIEQILKKNEICSGRDILNIDLNSTHLKDSLSNTEMLKLEEYLKKKNVMHYEKLMSDREIEKSKNLKCVLKQIFMDTPDDRLAEIQNILNKEQIYSGSDMKIVDTNELRGKKSLSDIEILKIEEYIKQYNRERYDDIKAIKMAEDERKSARLKKEEEIELYALKEEKELKYLKLKAYEEQKMIAFKTEEEQRRREEEKMLIEAKAKDDAEREYKKLQREKEIIEAKAKRDIEKEKINFQREMELRETRIKVEMEREKIKTERELMIRELKAKKDMERDKNEIKREQASREAKLEIEKENLKMQKEMNDKHFDFLTYEKKCLKEDVQELEFKIIQVKTVIEENSRKGFVGYFKNNAVEKKKAEIELEERKKILKSKNERITEIDKLLIAKSGS